MSEDGQQKWKCTGCFRIWPKERLRPDPLRASTLCCPNPSCEEPCHPVDSLMFVRDEVRELA